MDSLNAFKSLVTIAARDDGDAMCVSSNSFDGAHMGARVSSVFVILVTSLFGALFPLLSSRYSFIRLPDLCFFLAKYFGSGVIVATAFIHLLQPANENLSVDCLGAPFTAYPMAFAIALIVIFVMFFSELMAYRWLDARFAIEEDKKKLLSDESSSCIKDDEVKQNNNETPADIEAAPATGAVAGQTWDEDHYAHEREHQDPEVIGTEQEDKAKESYAGNLLNVFVLEFGIIFHSIFIGLTLACSGDEFISLYIVLVFHQMFEGLGLGTRIALVDWPKNRRVTPWILSILYGFTTPISIAIGLGVRKSYPPNSKRALIVNGCFDSVSAGILIYTGMIELMAHEFLFSEEFKGDKGFRKMILAYVVMCVGAGLMALLGKWA